METEMSQLPVHSWISLLSMKCIIFVRSFVSNSIEWDLSGEKVNSIRRMTTDDNDPCVGHHLIQFDTDVSCKRKKKERTTYGWLVHHQAKQTEERTVNFVCWLDHDSHENGKDNENSVSVFPFLQFQQQCRWPSLCNLFAFIDLSSFKWSCPARHSRNLRNGVRSFYLSAVRSDEEIRFDDVIEPDYCVVSYLINGFAYVKRNANGIVIFTGVNKDG